MTNELKPRRWRRPAIMSVRKDTLIGIALIFAVAICWVGGCAGGTDEKDKKFRDHTDYVKTNYQIILRHIREQSTDYISKARKVSGSLEKSIKKHGLERVLEIRNATYTARLDLALERVKRTLPEEELNERAKLISEQYFAEIQEANVSAPIKFTKKNVIEAGQQKAIVDVLFYERLLKANIEGKPVSDYTAMAKAAFSQKEYSELLAGQLSAVDDIYDAFIKAPDGLGGLFAPGGINKMRKFEKNYYKERAEAIYPTGPDG